MDLILIIEVISNKGGSYYIYKKSKYLIRCKSKSKTLNIRQGIAINLDSLKIYYYRLLCLTWLILYEFLAIR